MGLPDLSPACAHTGSVLKRFWNHEGLKGGVGSRVSVGGWERLAREVAGPLKSWEDTGKGSCRVRGSHGCIHH